MRKCLLVFALAFVALAAVRPAHADYLQRYLDVRCAEDVLIFSVREGATWAYSGPYEDGLIKTTAPAPEGNEVMARCTLQTSSGEAIFEVRRTELQRAANGLCQGVALAAFEITLNGITIAEWPHDYIQCVTLDYNPPRLARSVSFDSERVEVCAPVRLEGDRWLDRRDLTIQCRAEPLAAVLSAGAFPD